MRRLYALLPLLMLASACWPLATPPVVVRQVVTPSPPTATPECTPLLPGMSLTVTPISSSKAKVELVGFQPGELVTIVFYSDVVVSGGHSRARRVTSSPVDPVDASGRFTDVEGNLTRLPGAVTNHWNVQVVHARGVACTDITLS